jgi:hypothetical protein
MAYPYPAHIGNRIPLAGRESPGGYTKLSQALAIFSGLFRHYFAPFPSFLLYFILPQYYNLSPRKKGRGKPSCK